MQQALPAIIFAALRRFLGAVLFLGPRPSSRLGAPFWPSGLTLRSSGLAFSQPLTLAVRHIMSRARLVPIGLLVLTVLPVSVLLVPLVLFGLPFWIAGIADVIAGNYGFSELTDSARPDVALMFISAPLGLVSLIYLWIFLVLDIKGKSPRNRRNYTIALSLGILAGVQLLFVQFGILFFLAPATLYALYKLQKSNQHDPAA